MRLRRLTGTAAHGRLSGRLSFMARYRVNQHSVDKLLGNVCAGRGATAESQLPSWGAVRTSATSEFTLQDYPGGYLITWHSPGAAMKDGTTAVSIEGLRKNGHGAVVD